MDRKCTRKFPALEYSCYNILIYNTVQTGIRAAAFCRSTLPPETPTQSIPESFPGVKKGRDVKLTTQKLLQTNNIKTNTIVDKTGYSGKPKPVKDSLWQGIAVRMYQLNRLLCNSLFQKQIPIQVTHRLHII